MPAPAVRALLCAALLPSLAQAGVLVTTEPGASPLKVRKQQLTLRVQDQVARVTVEEVFENLTDRPQEGWYLLPLPDGAAISGFATWVDGQRVESRIEAKKKAVQTYEAAAREGRQPALLEEVAPGTFRTRVDGIPANGTKRIEASYAQVLPYDAGLVTVRVPMKVEGKHGAEPVGDFKVVIELADQKKILDVKVASHPATITALPGGRYRVVLEGKNVRPDEDLVVTYRTESSRLGLSFVPYRPDPAEDGYFLLLASPQELTTEGDLVQKDVVFVFDVSGSMEGAKIEQARRALMHCLSALNRNDRFTIIAFSDGLNPFRNKVVQATRAHVEEGLRFASTLTAGGGTNISDALLTALGVLEQSERPGVVVFLTDGQPSAGVTEPAAIAQKVKDRNAGKARLFSFGVGRDVNQVLLERLATENRGAGDFVVEGQTIEAVVGGFYAKISKPVLSELSLDFGEITVAMQFPTELPDLYKGSQLVMVGRYRGHGKAKAQLVGTLNGKRHAIPFEADFPAEEHSSAFVARLWAQRRIDHLLSKGRLEGETEEARSEVIALSERHQIITPYTSLVAVRAADTRLAALYPARVKPGDPVVEVPAPADAREVRVILPFGETKRALWDGERRVWKARFWVPAGTPDGSYPVRVEIDHADGRREQLALSIAVDTRAPAMKVTAGATRRGRPLQLHARAKVSPVELARAALERRDVQEAVESLFDVRRVSARLWDGREVELRLGDGHGFRATVDTNGAMAPGRYPVWITAQDYAGNVSRTELHVEVR